MTHTNTTQRSTLFDTLSTVDAYTQMSCLGSMVFTVTTDAIRRAIRLTPDHPTLETVEKFLNEERNLKVDQEYADNTLGDGTIRGQLQPLKDELSNVPGNYIEERRQLQALLELRRFMLDTLEEVAANTSSGGSNDERTLSNTLEFMVSSQKFDPVAAARQYSQLMKLGAKNYGQTRAQYVEAERLRAARELDNLMVKGEHAVRFLESLDPVEGPIDDMTWERIYKRCIAKLINQRMKKGMSLAWRTDPKQIQDVEADLLFIESAIVALGGEVPPEAATPAEAVEEEVHEVVQQPTTMDVQAAMMQFMEMFATAQQKNVAGPSRYQRVRGPGAVATTKQ